MNRFFISSEAISGSNVTVPDEVSSQIRRVLRLKEGTRVGFLDNSGWIYESEIHYLNEKHLTAKVVESHLVESEPDICVSLYIGLTQREKFEWILQKCTEAGVRRIIPMITERSLIRKASDVSGKQDRWEKILREAAEQCGRGITPRLMPTICLSDAVIEGADADHALFCWEEEHQKTLREQLEPIRDTAHNISLMVGPEGGFSEDEAVLARNAGWHPVTLGKRIYRMETAALVAVVLTLHEFYR